VPPFLHDVRSLKEISVLLTNVNRALTQHLTGQKSTKLVMAKDIVVTCAVSESCGSSRKVAKALGVDRQNIKKGSKRRFDLDISGDAFWISSKRAARGDALATAVVELVKD
jgi:hypothetical protein